MGIAVKSFDVGQGDFFLIKLTDSSGKYFNLMVDCGKKEKLDELTIALNGQRLNGIVVTHVDDDHITGVIELVENDERYPFLEDAFIIYNKFDETLITYDKGNKLYEEIKRRLSQKMLLKSYARNYNRENKAIERRKKKEELSVHILSKVQRMLMNTDMLEKDNVYITLLSPDINTLKKFMRDWKKTSESKTKSQENAKLKNQSSIVLLIEFNGKRLLMMGDGIVNDAYEALKDIKGVKTIDYIKLPHHGAEDSNMGIEKFCDNYSCKNFGITIKERQDGEKKHPNRALIESLIDRGCQIYTSTDYKCSCPDDRIQGIKKQSEIVL